MGKLKFILTLLISVMFSVVAGAVGESIGINPLAAGGAVFGSSLFSTGGLRAGINIEIWHNFIIENLYKNNAFIEKSVDVSGFVLNGSVVHIPNAGSPSSVVRNRQNLPAAIKRRSDTDITYVLDEFTTDPVAILRADQVELSYDKMQSVLANDMANIKQTMAEWMIYNWRPEGTNFIATTGSGVVSHLSGTTGNRKAITLNDLKKAQLLMNKLNLPENDRFAMFDSDMYDQLTAELSTTQYRDFSMSFNQADGIVGKLFGFNIMQRSTVLRHTITTNGVKTPDAAEAATDNAGVLIWQATQVERAVGNVEAFENLKDATMYGDVYSFLLRAGGRKRRADNAGTIAIVQVAA